MARGSFEGQSAVPLMQHGKTFFGVFVSLIILWAIFLFIERVLARGRRREQPVFRKGWSTDVIYWFSSILLTRPLSRLLVILPVAFLVVTQIVPPEIFANGSYAGYGPLSRQPLWLQTVQIFLLVDFIAYWTHRLFHRGGLWPFHAVHHSSEDLDWLGSLRVHPVNDFLGKLATATPVLLLGYNPTVTLASAPILAFYAIFLHANVNWDFGPLRYAVASPVFHRWHHSREREAWDKNFAGLLPLWDILFGTLYLPKGRHPENFGICEPMSKGYLGQFLAPFAQILRQGKKVDPA